MIRRIKEHLKREKEKKNTASVNDRYIAFRALLFAFERSDFYATRADREREREKTADRIVLKISIVIIALNFSRSS